MILGQDPYFRKGQAHGLAFSVRKGVTVPPSLNRIYNVPPLSLLLFSACAKYEKELLEDPDIKGFKKPKHGCLQEWASQGVLMLNAS